MITRRERIFRSVGTVAAAVLGGVGIREWIVTGSAAHWAPWIAAAVVVLTMVWAISGAGSDRERHSADARGRREDEPLISLVLLLRQARYLDEGILAQLLRSAWGIELSENEDGPNFVVGENPSFVVHAEGRSFLVNNYDAPYFTDTRGVAAQIGELRLRKMVSEHRGWISVDLMSGDDDQREAYRWIGRLIAELAGEDCLAIVCPQTGQINVYSAALRESLCGRDPLAAFGRVTTAAVLQNDVDDPEMRRAIEEARRCWPEFVEAFERRREWQHFQVRAAFSDGQHTELMWMTVTAMENGVVYGTLGNDPLNLGGLKQGQIVRAPVEQVSDWVYIDGDRMHGGFTIEVLRRAHRSGKEKG